MAKFDIKNKDIFEFWQSWKTANVKYDIICPGNTLSFPDPICKKIAVLIDSTLIENHSSDKSYDFQGNIEMKSSSKNRGATPFHKSQSNCSRVIFFRIINNKIEYYNITDATALSKINTAAQNGENIILMNYIEKYNIGYTEINIKK